MEHLKPKESQSEPSAPRLENRREWLVGGLTATASMLLGACGIFQKNASFTSAKSGESKDISNSEGNGIGDSDGRGTDEPICDPLDIEKVVETEGYKKAEGVFVPELKLYGNYDSALVVLEFKNYDPSSQLKIETISIASHDDVYLAAHFLSEVDVKPDGSKLRLFIFNHIKLNQGKGFKVLLSLSDQSLLKHQFESLSFNQEFRGKPVVSLSKNELPSGFDEMTQAVVNLRATGNASAFKDSDTFFALDQNGQQRKLKTLQSINDLTVAYIGPQRLNGFVVTDLADNVINENGRDFVDVIEHQHVICYFLKDNVYYRTIVSIG